ncbi:hypothetical protein ACOIJY_004556, partial [Cronobacter turicensis]
AHPRTSFWTQVSMVTLIMFGDNYWALFNNAIISTTAAVKPLFKVKLFLNMNIRAKTLLVRNIIAA